MTVAERTTLSLRKRKTQNKRGTRAKTGPTCLESSRCLVDGGLGAHQFGFSLSLLISRAPAGCIAICARRKTDLSLGRLAGSSLHTPHEALNLSRGVHDALLTGVERVADIAEVGSQVLACRARREGVAARARDRCLFVLGVESLLHCFFLSFSGVACNGAPVVT